MRKTIFFWALFSGLVFATCRCTTGSDDPFVAEKFDAFDDSLGQRVEAYHQAVFGGQVKREGKPTMYVDFSSGISQALADPLNGDLLVQVAGKLLGVVDVFKLSQDSIQPFNAGSDPSMVVRSVVNKSNYNDKYVPIKDAVKRIVAQKNDAILVTDFEEYYPGTVGRGEVTDVPYFKESFTEWLAGGNSIHFFIADYKEGKVPKHLYFTVFNYGRITNASLISRVESIFKNVSRFDLSNNAVSFSQSYADQKSGGIYYDASGKTEAEKNILDVKKGSYINGLSDNFEFYPLGLDWKTIGDLKSKYSSFTDLFRNLSVNLSNRDSYSIDGFAVAVKDVTSDFEHFAKCRKAAEHPPHITKGSNGENKFADTEKDAIALNCYDANGKIKSEWVYHSRELQAIAETFSINKKLLANTIETNGLAKADLAVSFDPRFDAKNISQTCRLLRVDIVIDKATPTTTGAKISKLSWTNLKGVSNNALASSVVNALTDPRIQPDGRVVYSYYITTLAQ